MPAKLHQTVFSVEKIRNVVNVGRCSAYQIYTTPGAKIGHLGLLELAGHAANQATFADLGCTGEQGRTVVSLLQRTLAAATR